jgi:hypothetical protein
MKRLVYLVLFLSVLNINAQENVSYKKPSKEILDLVDIQRAPYVLLDDEKEYMVLLFRNAYKTIEELSQEELRLGGLRIDPHTNIGSRVTYYNNIQIKYIKNKNSEIIQVEGLPENPRLSNFTCPPDQKKISLTNTTSDGVEVWVFDLQTAGMKKLSEADNNSGTYPMQSECYFNALKGLGATVRLVVLPKESHGYSAIESILHLLWEQDEWLERYVKNN